MNFIHFKVSKKTIWKCLTIFLAYNLGVVIWGAWVRISFSGDGCGNSWPLCDGNLIPTAATPAKWIEWSHRASTGLFGAWMILLVTLGFLNYPKGHPVRRPLILAFALTVAEALIGALLVKLELVSNNQSIARAWVMGIHQITSLMLTGSIFVAALYAQYALHDKTKNWRVTAPLFLVFGLVIFSGALAALAGTLFPSINLISGILADFDSVSHILVRVRLSHPLLATCFCFLTIAWLLMKRESLLFKARNVLYIFLVGNFIFGAMTLLNLSPTWMRLTHLALAHLLCMSLIYVTPSITSDIASNPKTG